MVFKSLAALVLAASATSVSAKDIPGAQDHPRITRFNGASIIHYQHSDFEESIMPSGKITGGADSLPLLSKTGIVRRIKYAISSNKSAMEVVLNYKKALTEGGFKIEFECRDDCGGVAYERFIRLSGKVTPKSFSGKVFGRPQYAIVATLVGSPTTTVFLDIVDAPSSEVTYVYQQTVEETSVAEGQVEVLDADLMRTKIDKDGRVAVYGIYFDTDSAELKPESTQALDQMGALLNSSPELKVFVVGHTDNQGSLGHNETLSFKRAKAVVSALTNSYKIDPQRLLPRGLASYAPVATNDSAEGRAMNRRVELVKQ